ncbi:MAG: MarR family transcriptional regulator, organic hydroperoxide resistance regulator [Thermomicrobiales bacterium]|jgi:DNA-binding MarR family transcriptional regulator|nr:MarR family transcriptional regulator, organic hydroperoxide resistance regulator [Thermomicrobiales bacterium]
MQTIPMRDSPILATVEAFLMSLTLSGDDVINPGERSERAVAARIEETTGYALARAGHIHRWRIEAALRHLGLHVGQEMVLLHLWGAEGPTQAELAERLGVEPPTLTKMLGRMEQAGLIVRRRDESDARCARVYLTSAGRALEEPVHLAWCQVESRAFAAMTPEERADLRRILAAVRDNLC